MSAVGPPEAVGNATVRLDP